MFFELTDEQLAVREMVGDLFDGLAPLSSLRQQWGGPLADGPAVDPTAHPAWKALAGAGLLGLGVPEAAGGSGGNEVDVAVVLEAAGRACLPGPLVDTLGVAAPVLVASGSAAGDELLPAVIAGAATVGVALGPDRRLAGTTDDHPTAAIVEQDGEVVLVPRAGLVLTPVATWDQSRQLAAVIDVDLDAATRLDVPLAQVRSRLLAANAMALVGTAQRMLDMAVEHAGVREQFGAPIGAYQAVAHPLAAVHVAIEAARAGAWNAALSHHVDPGSAAVSAYVAAVAATGAARDADLTSLQVHAGIGFTWEHDLHLVLKHAVARRAVLGDPAHHRAAVVASLASAG